MRKSWPPVHGGMLLGFVAGWASIPDSQHSCGPPSLQDWWKTLQQKKNSVNIVNSVSNHKDLQHCTCITCSVVSWCHLFVLMFSISSWHPSDLHLEMLWDFASRCASLDLQSYFVLARQSDIAAVSLKRCKTAHSNPRLRGEALAPLNESQVTQVKRNWERAATIDEPADRCPSSARSHIFFRHRQLTAHNGPSQSMAS